MRHFLYAFSILVVIGLSTTTLYASDSSATLPATNSWEQGFHLIDSGCFSSGLMLLDSLSRHNPGNNRNIGRFASMAFSLLFKNGTSQLSDTLWLQSSSALQDTLRCTQFKSVLISRSTNNSQYDLPSFSFTSKFNIVKPVHLIFNGLSNPVQPGLTMRRDTILSGTDLRITNQLTNREDSVSCTVYIDFSKQYFTPGTYLSNRFAGVFDSVDIKHDLEKFRAISIRGYTRKNWSIEDGHFTAILSFDNILPDRRCKSKKYYIEPLPVRYTIIVRAPGSMRDVAEAKLQSLIRML